MLQLRKALPLAVTLLLSLVVPTLAQTWTVESIDREQEDSSGPGFCVLRSSEGFVLSLSPYQNANYVGFSGSAAGTIGLRWLPRGAIQQMKALLQVDAGHKVLRNSTLHHVPRPESGGVLVDLYAYYPTGSDLIAALRSGSSVYIRVAEDLTSASSVQPSSATTRSYSLKGSAAAIAQLEACVLKHPSANIGKALGKAFEGLGEAIQSDIEASLAGLSSQVCDFDQGVWWSGSLSDGRGFYIDDNGSSTKRNVYFERWVDNKLIARMYGNMISSMGVSSTFVTILSKYRSYDEDPEGSLITPGERVADTMLEMIYET